LKLRKDADGEVVDATLYRSVIGSLRYLVNTHPDIAHVGGIASRYMEKPSPCHWAAIKQIIIYVKVSIGQGCCYKAGKGVPVLVGYSDSDHADDLDDRKSTSRIALFLDKNIIN
jgi:hypothetical protein